MKKIESKVTYQLTQKDIEEAITNHIRTIIGDENRKCDVELEVDEILETFWVTSFDSDTSVVGHKISATVELLGE